MDFFLKTNAPNSLIQKDVDAEKYTAIASKLCDKRKAIEDTLKESTLTESEREEKALLLIDAKQSLSIFGISEIDYQAYLSYKETQAK